MAPKSPLKVLIRAFIAAAAVAGLSTAFPSVVHADPAVVSRTDDAAIGVKLTIKGGPTLYSAPGDYGSATGNVELPPQAVDGKVNTKYFNRATDGANPPGINSGLLITPRVGATVVTGIQFATANDVPERDPILITIEGSNDPQAATEKFKDFTLIYTGAAGLDTDPGRGQYGTVVKFENATSFKTYRILITGTRESKDAVQYSEVRLYGTVGESEPVLK